MHFNHNKIGTFATKGRKNTLHNKISCHRTIAMNRISMFVHNQLQIRCMNACKYVFQCECLSHLSAALSKVGLERCKYSNYIWQLKGTTESKQDQLIWIETSQKHKRRPEKNFHLCETALSTVKPQHKTWCCSG